MTEEKKLIKIEAISTKNLGIMTGGTWFNLSKAIDETTRAAAIKIMETLGKGDEIELTMVMGKNDFIKVELKKKAENSFDDLVKFDTLLADAHKKGLDMIETEMIELNLEKKYALFKCIVTGENKTRFEAHGDSTDDNIGTEKVQKHWIRMAETRAISRALRWFTNNAKCSAEETSDPENPVKIDEIPEVKVETVE